MKTNSIQFNIKKSNTPAFKQKVAYKPYIEAEGAVRTEDKTKPLPPKGYLIHDDAKNSVKYFFKDIEYDFKSLKNSYNGVANDHQLGRLNDIGITTAGILIATYLASKTVNPKARLMEYIGLGAFLTAMSIYPKLAINTPAKLVHGFDIDKEYIDDQGRKKSVMQDANYVPYDMYLGKIPEEDISIIGDKMGIPRDIKNRNDVIKEQMRKISTQNNTLWMLTAGVTPAIAGLLSFGLEKYVVTPSLEKSRISKYNSTIEEMVKRTSEMSTDINSIKQNPLSKKVESLLSKYKAQELPKEEYNNLIKLLSENLHSNTNDGIVEDIAKIFNTSGPSNKESIVINEGTIDKFINSTKDIITKRNKNKLENILVPTKDELKNILKKFSKEEVDFVKGATLSIEDLNNIKQEIKNIIDSKIANATTDIPKEFLESQRNKILAETFNEFAAQKSIYVSEESIKKVVDFAKIIGDFKENQKILNKCKEFNVEHASDTVIARSYEKFERAFIDALDLSFSDLKKMRESEDYTKKLLDKKINEISKDEVRYEKIIKKLNNIVSEMEINLNGKSETNSRLLDLINSIENNYNKTAQRLSKLGSFESTIDRLVKEDVKTLSNTITSKQELFDTLDGVIENKFKKLFENNTQWWQLPEDKRLEYIKANSKGVGSSKNLEISRIIDRYQGAKNSFNRIIHTLDVYKRANNPESFANNLYGKSPEYINEIIQKGKETLLNASASEHTLKLNTVNNPNFYKDLMSAVWADEAGSSSAIKQKGHITETTKKILQEKNDMINGNTLDRFQIYISRFKNIIGNNTIDFTKPNHVINNTARDIYTMGEKTRLSVFNLIAQTPVDLAKGAAGRKFSTQKWFRIIAGITGSIVGVTLLSQFGFGKLSNPQNLQKQVKDDSSK